MIDNIKATRMARGLLARDVAKELEVLPSVYSRWENRDSLPRRVAYAMLYAMDKVEEQGRGDC